MKQTGVDSSIYFTNLKHNIKLIFGFQMSHEIGFSGKICFYTNLICHAKFSFTQLIFQHKVFSAKFGSGFNFKQIFSAIFSLIFLRKNRSEAFCVSSEKYIAVNVLRLVFRWQFQHQAITNIYKSLNLTASCQKYHKTCHLKQTAVSGWHFILG